MKFIIITLFPDELKNNLSYGVIGRAIKNNLIDIKLINPREFAANVHKTVDDRPFGGGPGMLLMAEPIYQAINKAKELAPKAKVYYLSPQGDVFKQATARDLAAESEIILLCGRYEGIDERVIATCIDAEISIGDYVLSGGELAAAVIVDAVGRLVPGVLGHKDSNIEDSFTSDLLDCPHYTRPEVWRDKSVPKVLLSGNHAKIAAWRKEQSVARTKARRPDL